MKPARTTETATMPAFSKPSDVSVLGRGMQITGNIVCAGALQIHGRVYGDIHATHLTICEGAKVEGKVIAPETIIQGTFNGSVHGNVVKLQNTAVVDGEIFNKSLGIEQNARFEGVSRRLEKAVEGPSNVQAINGDSNVTPIDLDTASIAPAGAAVN
ncbi:MAG: polymer-forming cytoskeletal protein [Pseudolabrys sp.]|nr:polymer-forming cytoskeletal protein [Pseudolabrys sp.]